ncbi:MAG: hypothetical protein KTR31_24315 [Myxococcales bacterium]|nr:hypothetical protein [Myxococcales bacterium]
MDRERFESLAGGVFAALKPDEDATLSLRGEVSEFVRLNHNRVRQPGTVEQHHATIRLIEGQHHATHSLTLGAPDDAERAVAAVQRLREQLAVVPEDPYLLWCQEEGRSESVQGGEPVPAEPILQELLAGAEGLDLVGALTAGSLHHGFASSRGLRRWDQRHGWLLDFSVVQHADRAVKSTLAGTTFEPEVVQRRLQQVRQQLPVLAQEPRVLEPDAYRVWLTPAATAQLLGLTARGGFSLRAQRTATTPLLRVQRGEATLSPHLRLAEDLSAGWAPSFGGDGFAKPERISLVEEGQLCDALVSPASAKRYDVAHNGASSWEMPQSLTMAPGELPEDQVLAALGTGIWVSNLWYLNFSDRAAGRITGMTRFSTLWVEDGEVKGPVQVMRFDETIEHLLGEGLRALSNHSERLPHVRNGGGRSTSSATVPGMLVDRVRFTL